MNEYKTGFEMRERRVKTTRNDGAVDCRGKSIPQTGT